MDLETNQNITFPSCCHWSGMLLLYHQCAVKISLILLMIDMPLWYCGENVVDSACDLSLSLPCRDWVAAELVSLVQVWMPLPFLLYWLCWMPLYVLFLVRNVHRLMERDWKLWKLFTFSRFKLATDVHDIKSDHLYLSIPSFLFDWKVSGLVSELDFVLSHWMKSVHGPEFFVLGDFLAKQRLSLWLFWWIQLRQNCSGETQLVFSSISLEYYFLSVCQFSANNIWARSPSGITYCQIVQNIRL